MASKVCLLTLATKGSSGVRRAREQIGDVVSDYFSDAQLSADFNSQKELIECLNSQLKSVHTAIIAAEPGQFTALKLTLMKTLSLRAVKSRVVADAVEGIDFPSKREYDLQVAMPEKARVFISSDGLYSGFAFKKGARCIIMLPLDCARLDYMLVSELSPFLGELSAISKRITARSAIEQSVKQTVDSLADNGSYIALSNVGCAALVQKCLRLSDGFDKVFVVDVSPPPPDGEENINSYIAVSAKAAKENTHADVGIAVSDICTDEEDSSTYTVVSIANSMRARVVKVYSEPGDDPKALVLAAIGKLLNMLDEFTATPEGLVNPEKSTPKVSVPLVKRIPVRGLVVIIACLFAAIAACVGIAYYLSDDSPADSLNSSYNEPPMAADLAVEAEANLNYYSPLYGGSMLESPDMIAIPASSALSSLEITTAPRTVMTAVMQGVGPQKNESSPVNTTVTPRQTAASTTKSSITTTKSAATTKKSVATTTKQAVTSAISTTAASLKWPLILKPTSAKPVTTKPATTKPTTVKVTEKGTTSSGKPVSGTFTFTTYGFGHGVGMSQEGAKAMANSGKTYEQIIKHYYPGTSLETDTNPPATVTYGGVPIELVEYLCRTTVREIGASAPYEALKAQICAVYTYAKYYNFKVASDRHAYNSTYDYLDTNVYYAALSYLGITLPGDTPSPKYVCYNGSAAFTCYFASAAGKTASAESVWGSNKYPYLAGGVSSPEVVSINTPPSISADELKRRILAYDSSIVLSDNPAEWLEILTNASPSGSTPGYVNTIRVGNKTMRGNAFRASIMNCDIRSHCFTFSYEP